MSPSLPHYLETFAQFASTAADPPAARSTITLLDFIVRALRDPRDRALAHRPSSISATAWVTGMAIHARVAAATRDPEARQSAIVAAQATAALLRGAFGGVRPAPTGAGNDGL